MALNQRNIYLIAGQPLVNCVLYSNYLQRVYTYLCSVLRELQDIQSESFMLNPFQ